jgi:hypothetical protein
MMKLKYKSSGNNGISHHRHREHRGFFLFCPSGDPPASPCSHGGRGDDGQKEPSFAGQVIVSHGKL